MTNVINGIQKEESNVYLNEIRQNAKKYNWLEKTEKNNCYVFSKDNVKINIIGLKGLATIEVQLINGVHYKMCRSNIRKEEISDLFSNTNYNSSNDLLNKTILCNYNLTVKEKIELFNKNDRSFLKNVKYKDIFIGGNKNLYKASETKTKIRNNIVTHKNNEELKNDYIYLCNENKNEVNIPIKIELIENITSNKKEMDNISNISNQDIYANNEIICSRNEIDIPSYLKEVNFYKNKNEKIIIKQSNKKIGHESKKTKNKKILFSSEEKKKKKESEENKNRNCEYVKKKTYLKEKKDECDKNLIIDSKSNEIGKINKNNDIDIIEKTTLNKKKKIEEGNENNKREECRQKDKKKEEKNEKDKEKGNKKEDKKEEEKNEKDKVEGNKKEDKKEEEQEHENQKYEINNGENEEQKKGQQKQLRKIQLKCPENVHRKYEKLVYSYQNNYAEHGIKYDKKKNKLKNIKISNKYNKNIFEKFNKNTRKDHYKDFHKNYSDKKNIINNINNLDILHNNKFNNFNNTYNSFLNYRNIRDKNYNSNFNNFIYKNIYQSNSLNIYTLNGYNLKNNIIHSAGINHNDLLVKEKLSECNSMIYYNIYRTNYNNNYFIDYFNNNNRNYNENFNMNYNNGCGINFTDYNDINYCNNYYTTNNDCNQNNIITNNNYNMSNQINANTNTTCNNNTNNYTNKSNVNNNINNTNTNTNSNDNYIHYTNSSILSYSINHNINCINGDNFNYNNRNIINDSKKVNYGSIINNQNYHINKINAFNPYLRSNYLNKYKMSHKEKCIKENSRWYMYNVENQNNVKNFNENKKIWRNIYHHRGKIASKNNYRNSLYNNIAYNKNYFNLNNYLYLKKKKYNMNYNNYYNYYDVTEDMINSSYFSNNVINNFCHLQLYNKKNRKGYHKNMKYRNFCESYKKSNNIHYNNSITGCDKNVLNKKYIDVFSNGKKFNKFQRNYKTKYIKKLHDKNNNDKFKSTKFNKIKKKNQINNVQEEIHKKISYLKYFKHDPTNSLPRYYCTLKHLLKENSKKKIDTWLKIMLTKKKCGYCNEKFDNLESLENHLIQIKTHKVFYCCKKPFPSIKYLHIHLKRENHYGYIYYY
ncbi:conserved Plasmodium protein, unknown function [Plasmodium gallinaceum]|uniref:Uncharacterized protein n=1 Tax=Plasmodium gallinaceum TaxID=5849 RepID=A0A1J1GX94_PLAGA|nr:conserved Plasmodium protein, unknown function [Plasmodium gallinaceum]CRG95917.1 conserved Plasmodium protein, unknown function [Plasmodium gallinaceum]